ncbi:uncharacterized protein LOC130440596 [Diorhabda sublineata]|uniref:uncharacterized protein LOC130440596 n=1 Tax=Diorhabda sublineata TaxID=1163346 RepID=UPI0024E18432|nr:uncharacterized protein LOC130440596 [Diorhabda sublineata]
MTLKKHGGWKSLTVTEGYVDELVARKTEIANKMFRTFGNFIEGASWSDISGQNCSLDWYDVSPTLILEQIINAEHPNMYMPLAVLQAQRIYEMQPNDVDLVALYLNILVQQNNDINITQLSQLVDAVMKIPQSVLKASQESYKSTDKILNNLLEILRKTNFIGTVTQDYLSITSFSIDTFYSDSIIWRKVNDTYIVDFFNATDSNIIDEEAFESGIILNQEIMKDINNISNNNSRIIIIAYFKPTLFNEYFVRDYKSIIYSTLFLNMNISSKNNWDNLLVVIYNNFSSNTFSCSYWNDGFWIHKTTSHSDSKILCSFKNTINVGLVSTTNITALLEELQKDISCYDSISKTLMYLKKYLSLFQPIDVSIVYLILDKCKDEDLFHIHMNIVNQLLDLPVNIIQTARTEFNANILQTFEQILIGYNREFPLTEFKNFMVAIQDIDQKNLTGLYISCNKNKCSVKMMHNYSYIPEESEIYLVFDEHLLDQLISNKIPRIIITLFANDAFFLTKSEYGEKSFSIIIGVTIPGLDMELEGNISVTYKLHSEVVDKTCEYWDDYEQKWVVSSPGISMNNQSYICTFSKTSYYVLAFNALNVTNLLETLLNSKENNLDILEGIENITSKHLAKLEAIDISLIAIYFQTIQNEDELGYDEIDISIQIINNLMHAARYIIQQAESDFYASSKILMFLKKQMTKIETSQTFCSTRIIVTVSYNTNVSGIEIYDDKNFCNYELIEKSHDYGINTTGIVFSEVEQISNSDQKIIIIAFYNDVFFYDGAVNNLEKNIMTIGVLVPDNTVNKFNEEISVFYSNITNDLNTITCVSWGLYDPKNIADGFWELQRKLSDDYSCNYFKEGWYTLWTQDQQINVTLMLEDIKDGSVERKLDQLEAVTSFYDSFSSHDVFLMLNILYRCTDLTTDSGTLSVLGRIIINFSKIPKDVKKNSQKQYKTNAIMLNFISKLATLIDTNINYNIKNYFQISVCNLSESSSIIIMDEKIDCYTLEENNYNYSLRLDYYPYILVNPEVLTVTIFKNNELFQNDENYDTSDIIHLSLKSYYNQLSTFTVEFNQVQIQKMDYSCACGSGYGTSSDHNWMYFKTIRNDFLTICEVPNLVTCSYVSLVNLSVTDILSGIYYRSGTSNKLLLLVNVLTYYQDQLQLSHIEKVYDILNICEIGDDKDLDNLAAIVDVIMDLDRNILASARDNFTEELHNCIEKLIKQFKGETRILQYTNFAVLIGSDITGILFEESNSSMYSIKRVLTDEFDTLYTSDITLIISSFMVDELDTEYTKVYLTVYFNDALFIGRLNMAFKKYGIIIGLEFVDQTIGDYMKIYFDNYQNNTNVCAYWNHQIIDTNIQTWYWDTVNQSLCENRKGIKYFAVLESYNVTGKLEDIFQSNSSTEDQLQEVIDIVNQNSGDLKPIDIHLIANILGKMLLSTNITKEHIELTSCIISYLFTVNKQILAEAQAIYSATDSILFTIDEILRRCEDVFVEPIIYNNFTILKTEFKSGNITGVILDECANTTCKISFLMNQTQISVISTESMEISIIFSDKLMQQIVSNGNPVKLILTVHFHNNFFTSVSNKDIQTSKILGIILDGLEDPVLQGPILITYKANHLINDNSSCSFWNYQVQTYNGYWQYDSTPTNFGNKYLTCEYDHLTHFVLLLAGSSGAVDYMNNSHILDILTNINSILSLLGLFGILLTAVLFDRWRNNTGNQILINFTVAVSIKNVMLYISEGVYTENNSSMGCTITGGILHYSILSEFCWMLIIAILQFKRFVEVLGGPLKYVLLKACICGWVFPSLPVFLIIIIDVNNYNASKVGLCYPSGFGLYLGVWLPLLVIISINSIIFVFILYNVFHKKTEYREQVNHEIIFQWRLAILLFSMLGLTWVFGFLALLSSVTIFAVIFCFLATLQGFIMFLFFIVFNKNTRYMYIQGFSWWMYSKGYKDRLH